MTTTYDESRKIGALGKGAYRVTEAARYTRLHPQRVRAWMRRAADAVDPFLNSDYPEKAGICVLSFWDMIDVLVAGQLRRQGVSLQVVRKAYAVLARELSSRHPFCHSRLCTDGKSIFLIAAQEIQDESLSEVITGQHVFPQILDDYLLQIDYDASTKLAERWHVSRGVLIDPSVSFGKPVAESTGTTTYVLAGAYQANGERAGIVADLFGVSPNDVLNAVDFERQIRERRAA